MTDKSSSDLPYQEKNEESLDASRDFLLRDFLRSLKVSFKNATIYNMEHPAFIGSVEDLQKNIEGLFPILNPIILSFTPRSLFLDERFWEGEKIYQELARLFHYRKIKTLKIRRGISYEELMKFTSNITLSLKDFLREGGAQEVITKEKLRHIHVEELDYSLLLKGEGDEISDIWSYLMEEGLEEQDSQKLTHVTENFEHVIGKFNTEELIVNEELQKTFSKYFKYLKNSGEDQYRKCAKNLIKAVVTNRKITPESKFENLKLLISDLREEDLADSLWEEIIVDDRFDSLSFSIFSKLIEKERHLDISTSLRDLFQTEDPINRQPEVKEKIQTLLSGTSSQFISEIYRQTLSNLLKNIEFGQKLNFDQDHLNRNYRYVLLNLMEQENQAEPMLESLEKISSEWTTISAEVDLKFLQNLMEVLNKHKEILNSSELSKTVFHSLSEFVENRILEGETDPELEYFLENLPKSVFDVNVYLKRMFTDKKVSVYVLQAFFKFFTEYLFYLNLNLQQNASDTAFLEKLVAALKSIDTPVSLVTLKTIYPLGNNKIKLSILQAMHMLREFDEKFLFQVLKTKDLTFKGESLALLMRYPNSRTQALDKLLNIQSPYGINNKKLRRHLGIIKNKKLTQARQHVAALTKRRGFWNYSLRQSARQILENWDAE